MNVESLKGLEVEYASSVTNAKIGLFILGAGILLIVAKFMLGTSGSPILFGAIAGGGGVYWAVFHDKATKIKLKLDQACYSKYGKPYSQSFMDIRNDRYPPKS